MLKTKILFNISALVLGLVFSGSALAYGGHSSWSYGNNDSCYSDCGDDGDSDSNYDYGSSWGYNYDSSDSNKKVKVSSWSDYSSDKKLKKGEVYTDGTDHYGTKRNGESYSSTDRKYVDNNNGYVDSVLFDYGDDCVVLEDITFSKHSDDVDMKIMAFIGDKKNLANGKIKIGAKEYNDFDDYLDGKTYSDLMNDGNWKGYEAENAHDTSKGATYNSNTGDYKKSFVKCAKDSNNNCKKDSDGKEIKDYTASSHWLVMADHTKTDYSCTRHGGCKQTFKKDYFKVKHMGGYDYDNKYGGCQKIEVICEPKNPPQDGEVPAPATLALLALGLGMIRLRKSK